MSIKYAKDQPAGFTNRIERVAIVGAGGQVGKHIAEELLKTGKHTVTALTRVGSQSQLPQGVKVVQVDYDDEQSLVDGLKGHQFFFISMAVTAPKDAQEKLIAAAAKAGVPWIMPNSYGADFANKKLMKESMTDSTAAGVEAVEKAGLSWIFMSCSFWYEYSLSMGQPFYGFDIPNKKATFYDDGKTRINTSTWRQCGRAAAQLLSLKELPDDEDDQSPTVSQWRNKPLYVSSFLISQRDMLDSINRNLGTKDSDWEIDYEASDARYKRALEMMQAGNFIGFGMAMYSRAFYPNGDCNFEEKYGLANDALGLPKEDFDEATKLAIEMAEAGFGPRRIAEVSGRRLPGH
ncbi:phenylcoumaran benzylic ether reductase TP7 [Trichoderma asperellum]|uniref:Phenylcoumaran benzylic ether reductase TP7 n=1 Tax=Trichoderma asperellum TaxID=101201 RepID=A0A6V8QZV7_TRIAP|nr:phenylcoumaran benzylic ether reductase TP7 [Trichoderma asperellum]